MPETSGVKKCKTEVNISNELTSDDSAFILWCLGIVFGQSKKMDKKHQKFINKYIFSAVSKIGKLHESLQQKQEKL